jgi:phosphoribosylaminoimidazolecarboxamide formyltransferase/IMP cyclohydrolase
VELKKIRSALISVYYKDKLDKVVKELSKLGVKIYSTGGTLSFINDLGVEAYSVESLTSYPSILGGRVKTLHPKVFGGILARRDNPTDIEQLNEYQIPEIDLVIVDLYPFEETVASGAPDQDIIEKIDIGGISLIRAAAKNHKDVVIVASRDQYDDLYDVLIQGGETSYEQRRKFAAMAFNVSSHYDTAIFSYFNGELGLPVFKQSLESGTPLRYGENPHQKAAFFGNLSEMFEQLNGKAVSYNNMLDIDAAIALINEFVEPTFAILKHNNACGLASRDTIERSYVDALACDPVSAYGGVLVANRNINMACAIEVNKLFFEVIIAQGFDADALELLKSKKNRIILIAKTFTLPDLQYRSLLNGTVVQERDTAIEELGDMKVVTNVAPSRGDIDDLIFANKIVKHSKSNAIVFAKNGQLLASGIGQTSRVDALKQAVEKAKSFGFSLEGAVLASDAFFPFADCVEIAHKEGVLSVIQPGGSVRDNDSVVYCDQNGMAMVFTGVRHFKH